MSVPAATRQPATHSALRRLMTRHPVAAFLVMVYAVNSAVALVPVLTRRDILPFDLAPYDSLGHIFGVALPAFIVVAAMSGMTGVRDLRAGPSGGASSCGGTWLRSSACPSRRCCAQARSMVWRR